MPRYDYECDVCHHRFELRQSFLSDPIVPCPLCNSRAHRQIHSVPVIFKGSGWYSKEYGKSSASYSKNGAREEAPTGEAKKEKPESGAKATKETDSVKTTGD